MLVSDFGNPARGTSPTNHDLWGAQSFQTDGNSYTLVDLKAVVGDGTQAPNVVAQIRADFGGAGLTPGGLLANLTVPNLSGPLGVQTFTPDQLVTLLPNTTYWMTLGVSSAAGEFGWSYEEGIGKSAPGQIGNFAYSTHQGASYIDFGNVNPFFIQCRRPAGIRHARPLDPCHVVDLVCRVWSGLVVQAAEPNHGGSLKSPTPCRFQSLPPPARGRWGGGRGLATCSSGQSLPPPTRGRWGAWPG